MNPALALATTCVFVGVQNSIDGRHMEHPDNSIRARWLWVYFIFPLVGGALAGVFLKNKLGASGSSSGDGDEDNNSNKSNDEDEIERKNSEDKIRRVTRDSERSKHKSKEESKVIREDSRGNAHKSHGSGRKSKED